jgi:hypothetical protein
MSFRDALLAVAPYAVALLSPSLAAAVIFQGSPATTSGHYDIVDSRNGPANDCDGTCTGSVDQAVVRIQVNPDYDQGPISEIWVQVIGTGPGNIADIAGASWIDGCLEEIAPTAVSRHFSTDTNSFQYAVFSFTPPILPDSLTAVLQVSVAAGTLNDSLLIATALNGGGWVADFLQPLAHDAPCIHLLPGRVTIIKPGALAKFVAKPVTGATFTLPTANPVTGGGSLRIFDTSSTAGDNVYTLPLGASWKGLGNPAGSKGYRYMGAGTPSDPCRAVIVKEKVIKGVCRGSGVTLTPPFTGDVGIVLRVGTTDRYCAQFGGDEVKNDATLTKRKNAPTPAACAGSPGGAFVDDLGPFVR